MGEFQVPAVGPKPARRAVSKEALFADAGAAALEGAPPGTEVTFGDNLGVAPTPPPLSLEDVAVQHAIDEQEATQRRLNVAQEHAKLLPLPDEAAKLRDAAKARGVPFTTALLDPETVKRDVPYTWDQFAGNKPLTEVLLNPETAVLTHDEADRLARIAGLDKEPFSDFYLGKVLETGSLQIKRDVLNGKRALGDGVLAPDEQQELDRINARMDLLPQAKSTGGQLFEGIVQQAPRMLRMTGIGAGAGAVGAAVGSVVGPAGAAAFGGAASTAAVYADNAVQAVGNVYEELVDQVGVPHNIAKPLSIIAGAAISGLDTLSFGVLTKIPALNVLKKIPGFDKLTGETIRPALRAAVKNKRFTTLALELAKDTAWEGSTEALQEIVQILTDYVGAGVKPRVEGGSTQTPTLGEATARTVMSGAVGAVAGGLTGGVATAGRELALRADTGAKSKAFIDHLYEVTDGLKTAERAPDVLKSYVDKTAANGPVQRVTLPVEAVTALAQKAETDAQKSFFTRPDIARQIEQAQTTGARVSMSLGDFVAFVRPMDEGKVLSADVGLNDEMSPTEAKELTPEVEKARKEMKEIAKRKALIENEPESLISRDLEKKLAKAGFTPEATRLHSELIAKGVSTLSQRAGLDPWETYQRTQLRDVKRVAGSTLDATAPDGSALATDKARGWLAFNQDRTWFEVTLTGRASLATFLHESSHYLFEVMRKLEGETGKFSEEFKTLREWAGVNTVGVAQSEDGSWHAYSIGGKGKKGGFKTEAEARAYADQLNAKATWSNKSLEQFARGMETYFGEGRAPSSKLAAAFATFKAWVLHVYRTLTRLGAPLTDEVRSVMDRMLASDEEIAARRVELGYFPREMPDAISDMQKSQQQAYRDLYEKGARQAQAELDRQAIASLRKESSAEFTRIQENVDKELNTHPVMALRAWFEKGGERIDGGLVIPELVGKKFDPDEVRAAGVPPSKLKGYTEVGGTLDANELAPYFGFKSGAEMLHALAETPARSTLKKTLAKAEMTRRYPAYGPDKSWVERAALEALHNEDAISNAIELELRASLKKAGLPPMESAARVAAMAAKENVREMTRAELDPQQYRDAESRAHRAAMKAFAAKDFKEEAEQNRRRLYARAMWREVNDAAQKMDKAKEYAERYTREAALARLGKSSNLTIATGERLGSIIRDAARSLVEGLALDRKTEVSDQPFAARIQKLEELGLPVLVDPSLREEALPAWDDISYAKSLAVRDALKNLSSIARGLTEVRIGEEQVRLDDLAASVREGLKSEGVLGRLGRKGEDRNAWRAHRMDITGPEKILIDLDGGKIGPAHRLWMGSAERGQFEAERRHIMRRDDLRRLSDEKRPADWSKRMKAEYVFTEGDGHTYKGSEVFAMLLNLGTATGRQKLVEGMERGVGRSGWTYDNVMSFIHRVFPTRDAYEFAQSYLTYLSNESLWEDSARVAEKIYGVRPEKLQALPIPLPDGTTVEGGYYPLIRNMNVPLRELESKGRDGIDAMDVSPLATMYAAHGFTEKRTGALYPLLLDPTAIAAHLYEVDHFISNAEGVYDRHRFIIHPEVKSAIIHSLGIEAWRELKASNNFIAAGGKLLTRELLQSKSLLDKMLFHNAILTMGGNVLSGVNQIVTGVPATIAQMGPRGVPAFAKALIEFARSPFQTWKDVAEASGEIRGMDMHYDKDLRLVVARELVGGERFNILKPWEMTKEQWAMFQSRIATTLMTPVVFGQKVVNVITFQAAKELALSRGATEAEAVAEANSTVRLSQSSSAEKDLTAVQRSDDGLMRVLTSLASYTFALNNMVMPRRLTQRELAGVTGRLVMMILATMMSRALFEAVFPLLEQKDAERRKGLEKMAEETEIPGLLSATQAMMDVLGNVPLAGRTAQALLSGRTPRYASWVETSIRALQAAPDALAGEGLSKQDLKAAVDTVGLVTGVPTRHVFFAPGEAAYEIANGNVEAGPWNYFQTLALVRPGQKGE